MKSKRQSVDICCVGGRYRRTIGKFANAEGRIAPKKFLLGTDPAAAEIANLRLEQLWREIVEAAERDTARRREEWERLQAGQAGSEHLDIFFTADGQHVDAAAVPAFLTAAGPTSPPGPTMPLWTAETLVVAEATRRIPSVNRAVPRTKAATTGSRLPTDAHRRSLRLGIVCLPRRARASAGLSPTITCQTGHPAICSFRDGCSAANAILSTATSG